MTRKERVIALAVPMTDYNSPHTLSDIVTIALFDYGSFVGAGSETNLATPKFKESEGATRVGIGSSAGISMPHNLCSARTEIKVDVQSFNRIKNT